MVIISFFVDLFFTFVYQPFFNILVAVYLGLDMITGGNADMGVALIVFTIIFRIIWIPVSLSSRQTEGERKAIEKKVEEIKKLYKGNPIKEKAEIKKVFKSNRRVVFSSAVNILLQTLVALMLYRMFKWGLEGEDWHYLYSFMPRVEKPFNLMFMGTYDLSKPSLLFNVIQAFMIFLYETIDSLTSKDVRYKREVVMAQFILPIVSFVIMSFMPAGKKMFIIVTLAFSIVQMLLIVLFSFVQNMRKKSDSFGKRMAGITD